jgi:hypothetical protein
MIPTHQAFLDDHGAAVAAADVVRARLQKSGA